MQLSTPSDTTKRVSAKLQTGTTVWYGAVWERRGKDLSESKPGHCGLDRSFVLFCLIFDLDARRSKSPSHQPYVRVLPRNMATSQVQTHAASIVSASVGSSPYECDTAALWGKIFTSNPPRRIACAGVLIRKPAPVPEWWELHLSFASRADILPLVYIATEYCIHHLHSRAASSQ